MCLFPQVSGNSFDKNDGSSRRRPQEFQVTHQRICLSLLRGRLEAWSLCGAAAPKALETAPHDPDPVRGGWARVPAWSPWPGGWGAAHAATLTPAGAPGTAPTLGRVALPQRPGLLCVPESLLPSPAHVPRWAWVRWLCNRPSPGALISERLRETRSAS